MSKLFIMKVAITAVSGQLGAAIAQAVAQVVGKENVVALARTPEKIAHLGYEARKGDYASPEDFETGLRDVEVLLVVSMTGDPALRPPLHKSVFEAAKGAGVRKVVYTSVIGAEEGSHFSNVVRSNRQTEADLKVSGLDYVIGRNGIYIEPDVEYMEEYRKAGKISNCAGEGRCSYTTRPELAYAYARMMTEEKHNGQTYNLTGEAISQSRLAELLNLAFGTQLTYEALSVADYLQERQAELGEFMGTIIAGIYEGIQQGKSEVDSDFEKAAGRPHQPWELYFTELKNS